MALPFLYSLPIGEMCVFTELGWIDSDYVSDDALILEDINTLPTEIAEALNSDEYDQCVEEAEAKMMKMMKKELGNKYFNILKIIC